jgi:ABC-type branched-subunit amino acid transport system ATPase component
MAVIRSSPTRRLVEIARALATDPGVILLDEPAAGLSPGEVAEMAALLARLRAAGLAVLLVEHHVELVLGLADHVTVLDHGRVLAEGPPDLVRDDPAVVSAYLGPGTVATRRTRRPLAVPEPISP